MTVIGSTIPATSGQSTDHHSGYYYIAPAQTVTVSSNKQMTTWGVLDIDGSLVVDGQLITEL